MTERFQITIPYRGSEAVVVVSVSPAAQRGYLHVNMPDGKTVVITEDDLALLIKCGLAERLP